MSWWDNMYNQSFLGSYQDAARRRRALPTEEEIAANDNDSWYGFDRNAADSALRSQQGQAVAGGLITGLTGLTSIFSNAQQAAQIQDTTALENRLDNLAEYGNQNYYDYNQLANDYAQAPFAQRVSADSIRGMDLGQQIGSVGTSALSGAATGLQIGGPWGALAGAVIGGGIGLGGVLSGNYRAGLQADYLNNKAMTANEISLANRGAAHERIGANIHRQNAINAVAKGGPIKRQSIQEFANKVLKKNRYPNAPARSIIRSYGEGGLTVRIKVK